MYKYVIGDLTRRTLSVSPPFRTDQRPSYISCLKVSQLLTCTTPTLPGLVLVSRCFPVCNFRSLTTVFVFVLALITLWVFPSSSSLIRDDLVEIELITPPQSQRRERLWTG